MARISSAAWMGASPSKPAADPIEIRGRLRWLRLLFFVGYLAHQLADGAAWATLDVAHAEIMAVSPVAIGPDPACSQRRRLDR